jgi:drug/metabolite transporter (DMT)-like permease
MGNALLPIFTILAYDGNANLNTILVIRFTLTTIFLFLFIALTRRHSDINRSHPVSVILLSGVIFTLSSILYLSSVKYISASLAVLCVYSYPIFVAILSLIAAVLIPFDQKKYDEYKP